MIKECRNIYQIARESKGLTQEKASELLNISVDSLRAYEGWKPRTPPDHVVIKMMEIYEIKYLWYQHLNSSEVGQKYLPNIEFKTLSEAVLNLLDECHTLNQITYKMINISKDNQIDENEIIEWDQIENVLNHTLKAIMAIKLAK